MSSSDQGRLMSRRTGVRAFVAIVLAGALAGCTVQPLYAPSAGGGNVPATMARVKVDPVKDRVAQQVRNDVIFRMTGGKAVNDPLYRMKLTVTSRESGLGITNVDASPVYSVQVAATYEIFDMSTGESLTRATARASASYNRSNQEFANSRARIDAENRAAAEVAEQISARIAITVAKTS